MAQDEWKAGITRDGSGSEWARDSLVRRDKQEETHGQDNQDHRTEHLAPRT